MASNLSPSAAPAAWRKEEGEYRLDHFGGLLRVWRDEDDILRAEWRGAVPAEEADPDKGWPAREPCPDLRIGVNLHAAVRGETAAALNGAPNFIFDSLRQTHPGFWRSLIDARWPKPRPAPLDAEL